MVPHCIRTSKRLTYHLIISQLKVDKFDEIAKELEKLYWHDLRSLSIIRDISPSDDLQKIVQAHTFCSEIVAKNQHLIGDFPLNEAGSWNETRKPMATLADNSIVEIKQNVNENIVEEKLTVNSLPGLSSTSLGSNKSMKRGRYVDRKSMTSNESNNLTNVVTELQKISHAINESETECGDQDEMLKTKSISTIDSGDDSVPTSVHSSDLALYTELLVEKPLDVLCNILPEDNISDIIHNGEYKSMEDELLNKMPRGQGLCFSDFGSSECFANYCHESPLDNSSTLTHPKPISRFPSPEISSDAKSTGQHIVIPTPYSALNSDQKSAKSLDRPLRSPVSSREEVGAVSDKSKPSSSASTKSENNLATSSHRINSHPGMLCLSSEEKLNVLSILKEGWKVQHTFEKRVRKIVSKAQQSSMEEILFAVFNDKTSEFVEFGKNDYDKLQIKVHGHSKNIDNRAILKYIASHLSLT